MTYELINPKRRREIARPFGWLPLKLLSSALWQGLSPEAKLLYSVYCVIADRAGQSHYGQAKLSAYTGLSVGAIEQARADLIAADLIAAEAQRVQVLSLPNTQTDEPRRSTESHIASAECVQPWQIRQVIEALKGNCAFPGETSSRRR